MSSNFKTTFIGIMAAAAIVTAVFAMNKSEIVTVTTDKVVAGFPGPDIYKKVFFHNGAHASKFSQGGGVLQFTATSTQSTRTLTQLELETYSVIEIVSTSSPAITLTLPATSTMTRLIPNAGESMMFFLTNKHASATTTTIAAGTGIILDEPDGQNVVIAGGNRAKIECFRDVTTNVVCSVDERIDAD